MTPASAPTSVSHRRPVLLVALGLVVALLFPLFVGAASAQAQTPTEHSIAAAVKRLLNRERVANHLRRVHMNGRLVSSARSHNLAMARSDYLAHQVRGEPALGGRLDRAGYHWSWNGENIGYNTSLTKAGVLMLERAMYNERAPLDGHRRNILNRHFRNVGVDVYFDRAHHKVWLTVDFGTR